MPVEEQAAKTATNALQAIPFGTLIGGPLDACISAQAQAAKTSWEFIQAVGLTTDPNTGEKKAVNVTFQYQRNGQMVNLVVPLLTIVPIPYIAIDTITIDFMANISASASEVTTDASSEAIDAGGSATARVGWGPFSLEASFKANYSSKKDSTATKESKYSVEYTMNVHVGAGQSDMPAGLAAVLNILQSSMTDAPVGGGVAISPRNATLTASPGAVLYLEVTAKNSQGLLQPGAEVDLTLNNVPAGLTLAAVVSRGDAVGQPSGGQSTFTVKAEADEQGVAGFVLSVKSLDEGSYPGPTTMAVLAGAVVQNPDPSNPGATVPTDVNTKGKVTTTMALPGPAPASTNELKASPATLTGVDDAGKELAATLTDEDRSPVAGATVTFQSDNANVVVTDPEDGAVDTGSDGKAKITVKKAVGATAGATANITIRAQDAKSQVVKATVA